ncbi:NADH dehydrogenase FAD-containing subunit [Nonomuraea thailandensis]|uniref:NADH dehydrogenase FAD-containing subunit n=1 Tax=Nonomuraea thailandensis TaxID=1188745 RepID=A0A9X2GIR1_9ACTN|nr:FAD-dependent oxidoreductase [Nonomuraea thailandensis]MCP2358452.1 NADH dehydrogenase FAD-containing subunit [Nonomuraea thailandensis]
MKNIVVLGGGYAGVMCAVRLALRTRKLDVSITLVNPSERFTERLRMHQVAAGHELADFRIPELLGERVTFVRGWATAIDTARREVTVDIGDGSRTLPYDKLVYALGSYTDTSVVPGADDHAHTLNGSRPARSMALHLASLAENGGTVAVCGGGLTGIEAATEIAENHPSLQVSLISTEQPGWMMGEKARAYLYSAFDRLGVTVHTGARITKVLPGGVEVAGGRLIPADVSLWTAGVKAHALAAESGIKVDRKGLILVDPALRSLSHPEIYAIGDAAAARQAWGAIHGTCQSGIPSGAHAADSIARELRGRAVKPFRFGYFHQPLSLGRNDALIQFTRHDDTPGRFFLKGKAAVLYKEWVSSTPPKAYVKTHRYPAPVSLSRGGRATREPFMEL